jgi:adenine-specific DNA-methyltransferase
MDARGEIYWSSNGNPRRKVYFDESKGIPVQDIWLDYLDIDNQNTLQTGYPTEKNIDMIKRIISASSNKGDIVLDCFAGSGTTMIAADELNRQWIGIDISEESLKTVLRRLFIGSKPLGDYKTHKKRNDPELFDYKQAFGMEQTYKITDFDIFSYKSQENFIRQLLNEYTRTNK